MKEILLLHNENRGTVTLSTSLKLNHLKLLVFETVSV